MDRRTLRADARRAAFEDAADGMEKICDYRPKWAKDSGAVRLYLDTREALVKWLRQRAKGVMGPPPGGVGTR